MLDSNRLAPLRLLRKSCEKPPMPQSLERQADEARRRHEARHANPGVAIDVEKIAGATYRLASPHSDTEAWQAMVCDALGTRSEATAATFLYQLAQLCEQNWHRGDEAGGGQWVPDEGELNMILNIVTGIKPRNEMQAALAAQMFAVHLMTMKVAEKCLKTPQHIDGQLAAVAGKLARTFVMQTEALAKLQGRKISRQRITVSYEKHEHRHVHMHRGQEENGAQPHAKDGDASVATLLSQDAPGNTLSRTGREGKACLSNARRKKSGSANGRS